ncbi:MAG: Na(+)-translocating NADH-quinone reductase subunit C [Gammaproteobacteria bacterium]|nr:Na(+)-translocating NADH-quinone reductase subunit C [Gammaproteobacteria bacterium]
MSIFNLPNDDNRKVILVAFLLCLACSLLVSTAAVYLRPLQEVNKTLDIKKNILDVAGLLAADTDINAAFAERIEIRIVDLDSGKFTDAVAAASYDQRAASSDPALSSTVNREDDVASINRRAHYAPVYLLKQGDELKQIILPIHGYGLWSTLYGFLALDPDFNTVAGIKFYAHGETPGLGGEIDNPDWQATWLGKQLLDADGNVKLGVIKGSVTPGNPAEQYQIDGLSGATLTGNGVSNMLQYWLGSNGFGPFLAHLKESGV